MSALTETGIPPIVCDTNVWYWIATGRIRSDSVADRQLIATFVSGHELCSSPNLYCDYPLLRSAILAMRTHHAHLTPYAPVEYLKLWSGYEDERSCWEILQQAMDWISVTQKPIDPEKIRPYILEHDELVTSSNQQFKNLIHEYRKGVESRSLLKRHLSERDIMRGSMQLIQELFEKQFNYGRPVNWEFFELFLCTLCHWLYELSIHPTMLMNENDWDDVLNLVYVSPHCVYWTEDAKKTKVFIEKAHCGHYLYNHSNMSDGEKSKPTHNWPDVLRSLLPSVSS